MSKQAVSEGSTFVVVVEAVVPVDPTTVVVTEAGPEAPTVVVVAETTSETPTAVIAAETVSSETSSVVVVFYDDNFLVCCHMKTSIHEPSRLYP